MCYAVTLYSSLLEVIKTWKERTRSKSLHELFLLCLQLIYCSMIIFKAFYAYKTVPTLDQFVLNLADTLLKTEKKKILTTSCGRSDFHFWLKD